MGIFTPHSNVHRHGLQWPPNQLQIFEVIVVVTSIVLFVCFCVPLLDSPASHIVGGSYGFSVVALICFAGFVAGCDPSAKDTKLTEGWSDSKLPWCVACKLRKQFRTEHCSFCNRCVADFDHHCIWLNNCVGGANYHAFSATLAMVAVMTSIITGTCLCLIVGFAQGNLRDDGPPKALSIASIIVLIILNFPLLVLDLNLMVFHIGIARKSMTTMEYLRACNAYEKEKALQDEMGAAAPPSLDGKRAFRPFPMWCDWVILRRRGAPPRPKAKIAARPKAAPCTTAVAAANHHEAAAMPDVISHQALREAAATQENPVSVPLSQQQLEQVQQAAAAVENPAGVPLSQQQLEQIHSIAHPMENFVASPPETSVSLAPEKHSESDTASAIASSPFPLERLGAPDVLPPLRETITKPCLAAPAMLTSEALLTPAVDQENSGVSDANVPASGQEGSAEEPASQEAQEHHQSR